MPHMRMRMCADEGVHFFSRSFIGYSEGLAVGSGPDLYRVISAHFVIMHAPFELGVCVC
jgi:hypothetical protein